MAFFMIKKQSLTTNHQTLKMSREKIIEIAAAEVGTRESPAN